MTIPFFVSCEDLFEGRVKRFEVGEEEVIVIVVNPQEGENGSVVSGIEVAVGVDVGDERPR